jgi:hypothetical protein
MESMSKVVIIRRHFSYLFLALSATIHEHVNLLASLALVTCTTIEPYAFGTSLLLNHEILATVVSFYNLNAYVAPALTL